MSRILDQAKEDRALRRREELVKALEYGLSDALYNQGAQLRGFSMRFDEFDCLLTLRADFEGVRHVCFVGSDTMMNSILKATSAAAGNRLAWKQDKYFTEEG